MERKPLTNTDLLQMKAVFDKAAMPQPTFVQPQNCRECLSQVFKYIGDDTYECQGCKALYTTKQISSGFTLA